MQNSGVMRRWLVRVPSILLVCMIFCSLFSSLYVVSADPVEFEDDDGDIWYVETITSGVGQWTVPAGVSSIDVLVVGGGGGSGYGSTVNSRNGGGGGAGGLIWMTSVTTLGGTPVSGGTNFSYSIGSGGIGGASGGYQGGNGGNTTFGSLNAVGGGGGGSYTIRDGLSGGSGGGGGCRDSSLYGTGGTGSQSSQAGDSGTYGYGYNGSNGYSGYNGGGGGGAGGDGVLGGAGGVGKDMSDYFGASYGNTGVFASGGGADNQGVDAIANTGMGGRAVGKTTSGSRSGASGVILIRYAKNMAPRIDTTYPINGTLGVNTSLSQINVTINDHEGDTFNWTIETSPDIGDSNGNDENNGTKTCSVTGLAAGTTYTVYVNMTDEYNNTRNETFTFTTFGDVMFYCYDETDPSTGLSFGVEITNSHFYTNHSLTNGMSISIADLPYGNIVTFLVSSTGYVSRLYIYTISAVGNYNFTFYLAPEKEESTLKTTSRSVSNPAVNLTITLDCVPEIIVSVQGWNSSYYGHWFEIPNDKYTVTDDEVEVDESCLDANTSLIKVTYYCSTEGAVQYLMTVYGPQGEYGHDPPISNVKINIKRYMSTTGDYETVSIVLTDGNGNADVYLMPGTLYRFTITKTGYNTENATKTLTETLLHHIFRLSPVGTFDPDDPDSDVFYDNFWADITITATLYENNTIHILFLDSSGRIVDTQIRVYDYDNNTETYLFVDSRTGEDSFSFWRSVSDASHDHKIRLWFNTSAEYNVNIPVVLIVYGVGKSWDDTVVKFNLSQRFENVFGGYILEYSDTLCVLIFVLVLALFGPFHAGAGIILSGFSVILIQALYAVFTTNANVLLTSFGVLALCLGILHAMTFKPEEQI